MQPEIKVHQEYAPVIQYNDENSLNSVLAIGYLSSMQYYFKSIREMPLERGFADFVYIPKEDERAYLQHRKAGEVMLIACCADKGL